MADAGEIPEIKPSREVGKLADLTRKLDEIHQKRARAERDLESGRRTYETLKEACLRNIREADAEGAKILLELEKQVAFVRTTLRTPIVAETAERPAIREAAGEHGRKHPMSKGELERKFGPLLNAKKQPGLRQKMIDWALGRQDTSKLEFLDYVREKGAHGPTMSAVWAHLRNRMVADYKFTVTADDLRRHRGEVIHRPPKISHVELPATEAEKQRLMDELRVEREVTQS